MSAAPVHKPAGAPFAGATARLTASSQPRIRTASIRRVGAERRSRRSPDRAGRSRAATTSVIQRGPPAPGPLEISVQARSRSSCVRPARRRCAEGSRVAADAVRICGGYRAGAITGIRIRAEAFAGLSGDGRQNRARSSAAPSAGFLGAKATGAVRVSGRRRLGIVRWAVRFRPSLRSTPPSIDGDEPAALVKLVGVMRPDAARGPGRAPACGQLQTTMPSSLSSGGVSGAVSSARLAAAARCEVVGAAPSLPPKPEGRARPRRWCLPDDARGKKTKGGKKKVNGGQSGPASSALTRACGNAGSRSPA